MWGDPNKQKLSKFEMGNLTGYLDLRQISQLKTIEKKPRQSAAL